VYSVAAELKAIGQKLAREDVAMEAALFLQELKGL
jgi:hypothetical protein